MKTSVAWRSHQDFIERKHAYPTMWPWSFGAWRQETLFWSQWENHAAGEWMVWAENKDDCV
jgi:hypothetical protein